MKTLLPKSINTVTEAKIYLASLFFNGESYHPEDSAKDIVWDGCNPPTETEAALMDKLMEDIYNLDGNNGNHTTPKFDPCEFLMDIDKERREQHIKNSLTDAFSECAHLGELIDWLKTEFNIV